MAEQFLVHFRECYKVDDGGYDRGLADGKIEGYQEGTEQGRKDGKAAYDTELLVPLGTEQPTAAEAITEINATLANILVEKGVEAEATETTEELVERVSSLEISEPNSWIYEWAKQCTVASGMSGAELGNIGDLNFEKATDIPQGLFAGNLTLISVGNITAPLEASRYGSGMMFRDCTNLQSVGNITMGGREYSPQFWNSFLNCANLKHIGLLDIPNYVTLQNLCKECKSLETFGGIKNGDWRDAMSAFYNCRNLREITEPLDFTSCTSMSEMFRFCGALKEMRWVPNSCSCDVGGYLHTITTLSLASLESILKGLANLVGTDKAYARTITLSEASWELLDAAGNVSPNSNAWRDYVMDIGWNT